MEDRDGREGELIIIMQKYKIHTGNVIMLWKNGLKNKKQYMKAIFFKAQFLFLVVKVTYNYLWNYMIYVYLWGNSYRTL